MKKLIILLIIINSYYAFSQSKSTEKVKIESTIVDFLEFYKNVQSDTTLRNYSITKGGYPDSMNQQLIDFDGLEKYLNEINQKKLLSETFLNDLRRYFFYINEKLKLIPPKNELNTIPGLETDLILSTFEPEEILDHIDEGKFNKINIIYNKALVRFRIRKEIEMLFVLTRWKETWKIDYIGYDNTYKYSFGKQ